MIVNTDTKYNLLSTEGVLAAISSSSLAFYQTGYKYLAPESIIVQTYPFSTGISTEYVLFAQQTKETEDFIQKLGFHLAETATVFFSSITQYFNPLVIYRFENSITIVLMSERDVSRFQSIQELLKKQFKIVSDQKKDFTPPRPPYDEGARSGLIKLFYIDLINNLKTMYELINIVQGKKNDEGSEYW